MIEIINKPLLLHLVGYLYNWQMGFNSVFKGLIKLRFFSRRREMYENIGSYKFSGIEFYVLSTVRNLQIDGKCRQIEYQYGVTCPFQT